jgi:hypothetical protein
MSNGSDFDALSMSEDQEFHACDDSQRSMDDLRRNVRFGSIVSLNQQSTLHKDVEVSQQMSTKWN